MRSALFFILLSFSVLTQAQTKKPVVVDKPPAKETTSAETPVDASPKEIEKGIEETKEHISRSRRTREQSTAAINVIYSPFDLLIPSKIGFSANYFRTPDNVWEIEYMRGKIAAPFLIDDLGSMTDERISISKRSFSGNSFNVRYGLTYFKFKLHLGSEILSRVSGQTSDIDLVQLEGIGFHWGLGNRWTIAKNFTVGVDWIEWNQPLILTKEDESFTDYATNESDKEDVDDAIKWVSYFPRINVLKLNLGYSF